MNTNLIETVKLIIDIVTACAIILAAYQIIINRKQLHLSTIIKCVDDYRKLGSLSKETDDPAILKSYIELTNEELFYFQENYLPRAIAMEWIDGMIDFMPLTNEKGEILNTQYAIKYLQENRKELLRNYPRIRNAFKVRSDSVDIKTLYSEEEAMLKQRINERKKLVKIILKNLKSNKELD